MSSEKPTGADNQQGSRGDFSQEVPLTPQRLHAELLAAGAMGLEAYLQGALRDGTWSALHRTHRIGQANSAWIDLLQMLLHRLGFKAWTYREGQERRFWVVETKAPFLTTTYSPDALLGAPGGLHYVQGYFDAEGGMPKDGEARLYLQFTQKNRRSLDAVREILEEAGIACGRVHNPSVRVDPDYWRFYVLARSHVRFMTNVGSWHPRKREQMRTRMKI